MDIYDIVVKDHNNKDVSLSMYQDKILLIVNTSIDCEYTYQYEELDDLDKKYYQAGLRILDFPSDQFNKIDPQQKAIVEEFCIECFNIRFKLFKTIDVNGALESPLYTWLKAHDPESKKDIDWNFEKFLVDQKGQVIKRYSYNIEPSQIESDIIKLLQLN